MNFLRWLCGLFVLVFLSMLIFKAGFAGINFLIGLSTFVFIFDIVLNKIKSF